MKMPGSVGTKKAKAVEQLLEELGVGEYLHDTFNAVFRRAIASFSEAKPSVQGPSVQGPSIQVMVFNAFEVKPKKKRRQIPCARFISKITQINIY